jgi:hypothetical protein
MSDLNSDDIEKLSRSIEELAKLTGEGSSHMSTMASGIESMKSRANETNKLLTKMLTAMSGLKSSIKVEETRSKKNSNSGGHRAIEEKNQQVGDSSTKLNSAFVSLTDRTKNLSKTFKILNDTVSKTAGLMTQQRSGGQGNMMPYGGPRNNWSGSHRGMGEDSYERMRAERQQQFQRNMNSMQRYPSHGFAAASAAYGGNNFSDGAAMAMKGAQKLADASNWAASGLMLIPHPAARVGAALGVLAATIITTFVAGVKITTEYMDKVMDAHQEMMSFGAVTGHTTTEMMALAQEVGFNSKNISKWTALMKTNAEMMGHFGKTTSDGLTNLTQFAKLTEDELMLFRRLGLSRESATEEMIEYARAMKDIGIDLSRTPMAQLNKDAKEYLLLRAKERALLGTTIEQQKKAQEKTAADDRWQAYVNQTNAYGTDEEKKKLGQVQYMLSSGKFRESEAQGIRDYVTGYGGINTEAAGTVINQTRGALPSMINDYFASYGAGNELNALHNFEKAFRESSSQTGLLLGPSGVLGDSRKAFGQEELNKQRDLLQHARNRNVDAVNKEFDEKIKNGLTGGGKDRALEVMIQVETQMFKMVNAIDGALNSVAQNTAFIASMAKEIERAVGAITDTLSAWASGDGQLIRNTTMRHHNRNPVAPSVIPQNSSASDTTKNMRNHSVFGTPSDLGPGVDPITGAPLNQSSTTAPPFANGGRVVPYNNDFQRPGASLDPKIAQFLNDHKTNTGIARFSGANDLFHEHRSGNHPKGKALDFVLEKGRDGPEDRKKWIKYLTGMGFYVLDEYDTPTAHSTGKHLHISTEPSDRREHKPTTVPKTTDIKPNHPTDSSNSSALPSAPTNISFNDPSQGSMLDELRLMRRTLSNIETSLA